MARLGKNINKKEERKKQEMLSNRKPIIEECKKGEEDQSCEKIENGFCKCYIDPSILWRCGPCPLASHMKVEPKKKSSEKIRVGQQKHIKIKK